MATLVDELKARDLLQDSTPGLLERLREGPIAGYAGFDPTADSLHVGNLVPVMGLAWLQRCGGTPIVVVGGGTGMVGDPSGKRSERPVLSLEQIDHNVARQRAQLERFVRFDGPNAARVRNNADWLRPLGLMEFLRDAGKHFTVNYMLAKDSVRNRMDTGISYTEFTYMLIQAYDFWHLWRSERCELQLGGSDQWGNITAGTELISRKEGAAAHGLVMPLLTTASGAKFGKSEEGAVYLDPARTSPYRFFQFWVNSDDRDVERWLKTFTFFPVEEVAALMGEQARDPGKRPAQRRLAEEMTTRIHGADACRRVVEATRILFGGSDLRAATEDVLEVLSREVACVRRDRGAILGAPVVALLEETGLAASKSDARRGIAQKAFTVSGREVAGVDRVVEEADLLAGGWLVLRKGKKNFALVGPAE
jgi:tyrosyl-tRNA synthetase